LVSAKPPRIEDYYILLYAPHHERAVGDGYVPEQILVAEKTLGRKLTHDEEVRHINGQPHDNRPANLEILSVNAGYRTQTVEIDIDAIPRRTSTKTFIPCKFQKPCWKTIRGPIAKREGVYLPYVCSYQTEGDIYKCSRFWNFVDQTLEEEKEEE
jgi:hypothetical protein